jgi:hypothetical protein
MSDPSAVHEFGGGHNGVGHARKDDAVEGQDGCPVEPTRDSARKENCSLPVVTGPIWARLHGEFQPGEPGNFHLGTQAKKAAAVDSFDAPPVEGLAGFQGVGMHAPAPQPDASDEFVGEASCSPGNRQRVPAVLAADSFDDAPHVGRAGFCVTGAVIRVYAVSSPLGVGGQRVTGCTIDAGVLPAGFEVSGFHALECEMH